MDDFLIDPPGRSSTAMDSTSLKSMKFGFRKPSHNKRIAARTSLKRILRYNLGPMAPRGMGWLTNPKKAE